MNAAVEAIKYALDHCENALDSMTFLRLWNEGEFDKLRAEWDDIPQAVFDGAEVGTSDTSMDASRMAKLLTLCSEAKTKFGPKNQVRAITLIFKNSVQTSVCYQEELRKLIDDINPTWKA